MNLENGIALSMDAEATRMASGTDSPWGSDTAERSQEGFSFLLNQDPEPDSSPNSISTATPIANVATTINMTPYRFDLASKGSIPIA